MKIRIVRMTLVPWSPTRASVRAKESTCSNGHEERGGPSQAYRREGEKPASCSHGACASKDQEGKSQVSQEKLVIQRKSKSVNVTGIQNISESVLGDETTHVCSGKMLIILLKAHCVNVNVQSWLSDFTIAKETS